MYYWKNENKYYKLQFQQNFFGATDIICTWGKDGTKRGGYKIVPCNDKQSIELMVNQIKRRRKYRGYIIANDDYSNGSMNAKSSNNRLSIEEALALLRQSSSYKVLEQYQRPESYNANDDCQKFIGVFVDVETTGLDPNTDKIIELGMVKFEYSEDGRIFRVLEEFCQYNDPGIPIPQKITELTGITDGMVAGHHLEEVAVTDYLSGASLIISHNAAFDRGFLESMFPQLRPMPWACLVKDIDWRAENITSSKLEYIAYKYGFFYEGHRAIIDCLVGIHVLAKKLPQSQKLVLAEVLHNSSALIFKIWVKDSPYSCKDTLKNRGYRWGQHSRLKFQAWSTLLTEDKVESEVNYLKFELLGASLSLFVEVMDSYNRFSGRNTISNEDLYREKIDWVKNLY